MKKQTNRNPRWFQPDVSHSLPDHLLGEEHTARHKFIFGTFISVFGLTLVWCGHMTHISVIEGLTHHVGYGIHGIGWLPVASAVENRARRMRRENKLKNGGGI